MKQKRERYCEFIRKLLPVYVEEMGYCQLIIRFPEGLQTNHVKSLNEILDALNDLELSKYEALEVGEYKAYAILNIKTPY